LIDLLQWKRRDRDRKNFGTGKWQTSQKISSFACGCQKKGGQRRGKTNPSEDSKDEHIVRTRLSPPEKESLLREAKLGRLLDASLLASKYGVSVRTVYNILSGKSKIFPSISHTGGRKPVMTDDCG
jgi:hypothetical protein